MNEVLGVLHVVGAVFIIGPMAILPMTGLRALRAGEGGQLATLAKSTFIFTLLSLLVAIFGFGLAGKFVTVPWVLISIILYLVALIINLALVVPAMRSAVTRLASGSAGDASGSERPRIAIGSGVSSLLLVAVTVLMVLKPAF